MNNNFNNGGRGGGGGYNNRGGGMDGEFGGGGRGGGGNMGNNQNIGGGKDAPFGGMPMPMNVSPEMINMGFSAGQDMFNRQRDKWMPGMSSFWISLKYYFAVNKPYVVKKLKILMFPPSSTHWSRIPAEVVGGHGQHDGQGQGHSGDGDLTMHKWALPKDDVNGPDLYIPVMAFISYCILLCYSKGAASSSNSAAALAAAAAHATDGSPIIVVNAATTAVNTPDVLINAVWKCTILQVFEALALSLGLNLMGVSSVPFLDIIAYTGYKYVGLCVSTLAWFLGSSMYFLAVLYTAAMLGYFVLKSLAAVVPREVSGPLPRHIMLLLFASLQFLISVVLCCY